MEKVQPLFESTYDIKFNSELTEGNKEKSYYIEGITLQGNRRNGNNRIYPTDVLQEAINTHYEQFFTTNRALGELGHPKENLHEVNYKNASHKFVQVEKQGDNFWTKALVLNTPNGKIVQNLIEGEVGFGISSRGFGPTKLTEGVSVVQRLHLVSLGDIEHNQSAPDALMTAIMESKEWVWENGNLLEKDIEPELDGFKKALNEASTVQIDDVMKQVMKEYFDLLKR